MDTSTVESVCPKTKDVQLDTLLANAQEGDEAALGTLISTLSPRLVGALRKRLCRDEATAHSVVQDAWSAAWQKLEVFKSGAHLRQWLFRVTHNLAVSRIRKACSLHRALESIRPAVAARQQLAELCKRNDSWDTAGCRELFGTLPRIYRAVTVLHYIHGRSTIEIASLLGISRPAVKMRLHRARHHLRRRLAAR